MREREKETSADRSLFFYGVNLRYNSAKEVPRIYRWEKCVNNRG